MTLDGQTVSTSLPESPHHRLPAQPRVAEKRVSGGGALTVGSTLV